ncbi:MAG TPA: VWA domain-containing protein [Thermoanaerobaculia bacterium]|jgi:VWFA-related protein|nr:VWA domain-containing protein [Thermoanaerobaculia bacterium]
MNRIRRTLGVLSVLATTAPLAGQTPAQAPNEPPPIFGEQIEVRVVNVEAVVTDKDGNRVNGLQPSDFRLRVDGKEVPVEFFTEVMGRQAVAPAGGQGQPAAGVRPGEAVGTYYMVFIDDFFSQATHRNKVLESLKADLARLGPDDRMAVVAFDGGSLEMLSSWSNSTRELSQAFSNAMARPARGPLRATELREMINNERFELGATDPFAGDGAPSLNQRIMNSSLSLQEKAYGQTLAHQIQDEVSAVVSAMRASSGVPGRKVLLLLSGGWPYSLQSYIRGDQDTSLSRELPDGEKLYRPLTTTANLLGYTIYPVDVPGVQGEAADAGGAQGTGERFREQEVEGALTFVAKETGGRPMMNTQREKALEVAETDTRSYYWLGFTPTWERNDKTHKIDVDIKRPGLTVRSRNSFLDLSKQASVSMMMESALLFGNLPDAIQMPVKLGAVSAKKGGVEIPITLALPVDAFTAVPVNGKYHAKLELRVAATDDQGNRSEIPVIPLDLASDKEPKAGGYVKYETKVTVKGKPKHLVLATYDPLSGKVATSEIDVP